MTDARQKTTSKGRENVAFRAEEPPPRLRFVRRAELPEATIDLARWLIGRYVLHARDGRVVGGEIVETEAYPPGDLASHAWRGRTPRNGVMYGRRGHAYMYLCYGTARMLNVTSERDGVGAAVLVRALRPVFGIERMREARGARIADRDLARGPGRLAHAIGADLSHDGVDLCAPGPLRLATPRDHTPAPDIACSTRIGIAAARDADRVLRYFVRGSAYVSGAAALNRA